MSVHGAAQNALGEIHVRLGAEGLSKRYGQVEANRDISISVVPGEIHAIVGENGAGKSTLMRMLQGIEQPDSGRIIVDDEAVTFSGPQQAFALGIGMVHQEFMLAPDLTLLENLVLGDEPVFRPLGPLSRINWAEALRSGEDLARQTAVEIDWSRKAGKTPVHVRQFVEIIRLLRRGARILILDEPTAVLAPGQVDELFDLLRSLRVGGTTIIFISHKLREVMALADQVTVIRRGAVCFTSPVSDTDTDTIAEHMIGEASHDALAAASTERKAVPAGDVVFQVESLTTPGVEKAHPLHGINLSVGEGEILGIAGVSGNGQNELVECLVGLRAAGDGRVTLKEHDITNLPNLERRALGLGYISADRRDEGLALDATVETNVVAGSQRRAPVGGGLLMNLSAMREMAARRLELLDVRYGGLSDAARSLSGGNQQRLVFAREIAAEPELLVVSQPTRGVDLKGIAAIHTILRNFRDAGGSVLLVSEELDELLTLSDRICVMADGRVVGEVSAAEADVGAVGKMMVMQGGSDG